MSEDDNNGGATPAQPVAVRMYKYGPDRIPIRVHTDEYGWSWFVLLDLLKCCGVRHPEQLMLPTIKNPNRGRPLSMIKEGVPIKPLRGRRERLHVLVSEHALDAIEDYKSKSKKPQVEAVRQFVRTRILPDAVERSKARPDAGSAAAPRMLTNSFKSNSKALVVHKDDAPVDVPAQTNLDFSSAAVPNIPAAKSLPEDEGAEQARKFAHDTFGSFRAVVIDGEPWFVAMDVARALEYSETSKMLVHVEPEDRRKVKSTFAVGFTKKHGNNDVVVISQDGVLDAIGESKLPKAKALRKWFMKEVFPQLITTGFYIPESAKALLKRPSKTITLSDLSPLPNETIMAIIGLQKGRDQQTMLTEGYEHHVQGYLDRLKEKDREIEELRASVAHTEGRLKVVTTSRNNLIDEVRRLRKDIDALVKENELLIESRDMLQAKLILWESSLPPQDYNCSVKEFSDRRDIEIWDNDDKVWKPLGQNSFFSILRQWGWIGASPYNKLLKTAKDAGYMGVCLEPTVVRSLKDGRLIEHEPYVPFLTYKGCAQAIRKLEKMAIVHIPPLPKGLYARIRKPD